ncbi:hypothetical protein AGMMS49992_19500 [Clostridia bacterium]|nr:hypothetical protein AGMMS49992_19500 [Clostridia bacterium]
MSYYIGLDIGGTKCAVVLAYLDHGIQIQDKLSFPTETPKGFAHTLSRLYEAIDIVLTRNHYTSKDIEAIGISCGGPLDSRTGIILSPPNLPGWVNIPLPRMLTEKYGMPAFLQNDANACALVEWKLGAGRGTQNMIFLTMGTGMGSGIIAEGILLRGHTDMGGEIGHLRLAEDGPIGFEKAGSFEGFTSGGGIARQAVALTQRLIEEGNPPAWVRDGHLPDEVDARLLAGYARTDDPDAIKFFNHIGTMLGKGISLLVDTLNPECVVIGSVFVRCEDLLRASMERELRREAIPYSLNGLRIVPAQTGESIGDLASVMVALYAMGIEPIEEGTERNEKILAHFERLFARYPLLDGTREQVMQAYEMLERSFRHGGKLLLIGNGGSCADCDHIVGELMKGFYLKRPLAKELQERLKPAVGAILPGAETLLQRAYPAISLTQHAALSTAFSNDVDGILTAAQQVIGYGRPGDVLLAISTSGNAKNVLLAVETAKALGVHTLGLTGGTEGKLKEACDYSIIVPGNTPADVQELHLPVYHTLCAMLEEKLQ